MHLSERQDIEIAVLIQALKLRHGYDFSRYAQASLKRRIQSLTSALHARSISEVTERVIHDDGFVQQVIQRLSVPVSEMFREPQSFVLLREQVLPRLASYPHINIWQAGCAHGEEVYSMAIVLKELGLYERAHLYATDISDAALAKAQEGIYAAGDIQQYEANYRRAGGRGSLQDYCTARYQLAKMHDELKANITFANHNLVSDGVFGEMHLILCRNVLIYFTDVLQDRVLKLFMDSLVRGGYLCLGARETLVFSSVEREFRQLHGGTPVFVLNPRNA